MISGPLDRRRRALFFSTLASAAFHIIFLTALFYIVAHTLIPRGAREVVSQATLTTIRKPPPPPPTPKPTAPPKHITRPVHQRQSARAAPPVHELAKQIANAPAQLPPPRRPTLRTRIERDSTGFANEVAQLNKQDDPHAIPTIDPSSRGSATKSYQFDVASLNHGDEHGNGIITPTQSWRASGQDCYYGRYEFTYPDGAMESGNIVWPFCYQPGSDPFKLPPHPMPFPLPLPGYKLPADTQLPPLEKQIYEEWAGIAAPAPTSTP